MPFFVKNRFPTVEKHPQRCFVAQNIYFFCFIFSSFSVLSTWEVLCKWPFHHYCCPFLLFFFFLFSYWAVVVWTWIKFFTGLLCLLVGPSLQTRGTATPQSKSQLHQCRPSGQCQAFDRPWPDYHLANCLLPGASAEMILSRPFCAPISGTTQAFFFFLCCRQSF